MSTRCQVEIKSSGLSWNENTIVLYHHCDGYPTNMLPIIHQAYKNATALKIYGKGKKAIKIENNWQAGRAGKAASQLCAADADGFDVESGTELHGDIEWFYSIECVNPNGGHVAEKPYWNVTVYRCDKLDWDNPKREQLTKIVTGNIVSLFNRAEELEKD